jgi:hypothetical protein
MDYTVILHDGTEIPVDEATIAPSFVKRALDKPGVLDIWDKLTPENLEELRITRNNTDVGIFHDVTVEGVQVVVNPDGTYTGHYYLRAADAGNAVDEETREYVQAAKILLGEEGV